MEIDIPDNKRLTNHISYDNFLKSYGLLVEIKNLNSSKKIEPLLDKLFDIYLVDDVCASCGK